MTQTTQVEKEAIPDVQALHESLRRLAMLISGCSLMILLAIAWPFLAIPFALVSSSILLFVKNTSYRVGLDERDMNECKARFMSTPTADLRAMLGQETRGQYRPEALEAARQILGERETVT